MSVWIIHLPSVCPPPPQYASIGLCPSGMRGICSRSSSWQVGRCPIIHCTGFAMHGTPHIQPFIVSGSSTITFAFADTHPNCTGRCVWPRHGQWQPQMHRFEGGGRQRGDRLTDAHGIDTFSTYVVCHTHQKKSPRVSWALPGYYVHAMLKLEHVNSRKCILYMKWPTHMADPPNSCIQQWDPAGMHSGHSPTVRGNLNGLK